MIKTSLKLTAVAALLAGASVAANAATTDLGAISGTDPKTFSGVVQGSGTSINDIFTFSLDQNNVSSGYSVVNIPLSFTGGEWNTALATLTLSSNADGIVGNSDDQMLATAIWNQGNNSNNLLSIAYDSAITGPAYIQITGVTDGGNGGIYSGAIAAAVPEPETYAMLLAGLGLMGAVVRRRSSRKTS
ncbi:PEP-CTERM protein-sorting domain-containing protein [Nitrosospira sp. Nsp14]|uniref:FxDxF family PEP-CTERM protein n=1 Tax=Nitrosospira sp. Nsp14 TaxID=1855333 RepID=UPI0008EB7B36|nr:FxDxF family PEP-CTERM protein [Nitrosospira sp. Nsp14]SFH18042.1 PEP-CTERM protein-sorting domain-containing protein [Nitrosospira sp. Nsp14]